LLGGSQQPIDLGPEFRSRHAAPGASGLVNSLTSDSRIRTIFVNN